LDVSDRIVAGCSVGGGTTAGEFVITGRGGLPPNPSDPLTPDATFNPQATQALPVSLPNQPAAIVEAQGFIRLPNGRIRLVAQAANVTPYAPWQPGAGCIH
jgi:large exoprotein involved in heme utilization and adhesion